MLTTRVLQRTRHLRCSTAKIVYVVPQPLHVPSQLGVVHSYQRSHLSSCLVPLTHIGVSLEDIVDAGA
jgi:hypothetical protein